LRWSFIGPSETVELNARGRLDATSCRYRGIYERLFTSMQRRVDWAGPVFGTVERQRPPRVTAGEPAGRAPVLAGRAEAAVQA
jgi:hypothetical protein